MRTFPLLLASLSCSVFAGCAVDATDDVGSAADEVVAEKDCRTQTGWFSDKDKERIVLYSEKRGGDIVARSVTLDLDLPPPAENYGAAEISLQLKSGKKWKTSPYAPVWSKDYLQNTPYLIALPDGMTAPFLTEGRIHVKITSPERDSCAVDIPLVDGSALPASVTTATDDYGYHAELAHSVPITGQPTRLEKLTLRANANHFDQATQWTISVETGAHGNGAEMSTVWTKSGAALFSGTGIIGKTLSLNIGKTFPANVPVRITIAATSFHRGNDTGHITIVR